MKNVQINLIAKLVTSDVSRVLISYSTDDSTEIQDMTVYEIIKSVKLESHMDWLFQYFKPTIQKGKSSQSHLYFDPKNYLLQIKESGLFITDSVNYSDSEQFSKKKAL